MSPEEELISELWKIFWGEGIWGLLCMFGIPCFFVIFWLLFIPLIVAVLLPWKSPREKLDQVAGVIGCIWGAILTAVSGVGGLIILAILALPYMVFRELLPGPNKLPPSTYYPSSSSIDTSTDDDYGPDGHDDHDSDDDGSFWDGWLVKW